MQGLTLNLNITIGELTEENEKRIISLVEEISKTTKIASKVQNGKKKKNSKPKILKSEKEIAKIKKEIMERIRKRPNTTFACVVRAVFKRIRFTLNELNEELPNENPDTVRGYVNDLKNMGVIQEMDRGKFVLK